VENADWWIFFRDYLLIGGGYDEANPAGSKDRYLF
jgi:hypothetical protein